MLAFACALGLRHTGHQKIRYDFSEVKQVVLERRASEDGLPVQDLRSELDKGIQSSLEIKKFR